MNTTPTLHLPVPMQSRVIVPKGYLLEEATGTVAGVAMAHHIFSYIVILDKPIPFEGESISAITVGGSELMDEAGHYAWRLPQGSGVTLSRG